MSSTSQQQQQQQPQQQQQQQGNNGDYDSRRFFPFGLSPIPEVPSELASEVSSICPSPSPLTGADYEDEDEYEEEVEEEEDEEEYEEDDEEDEDDEEGSDTEVESVCAAVLYSGSCSSIRSAETLAEDNVNQNEDEEDEEEDDDDDDDEEDEDDEYEDDEYEEYEEDEEEEDEDEAARKECSSLKSQEQVEESCCRNDERKEKGNVGLRHVPYIQCSPVLMNRFVNLKIC